MFLALDTDTKSKILFPQVSSESVLMHGSIPELDDSFNN